MKPKLYEGGDAADALAPWGEAVESATRNLGLTLAPNELSAEHWQRVLAAVEARMRLRGVDAPDGWRESLAARVGRND